jgi:3-deoxy-D-manno-octulosonic-acid transferase
MYFFYRVLTALSMLVLAPYYALRGWRRGQDSRALRQRFGGLPPEITARTEAGAKTGTTDGEGAGSKFGAIWIHAVSVGEVLAAKPLVEGLKRREPEHLVYVSTTTETGQQLARERLQCADAVFYFPLDWVIPVRRALRGMKLSVTLLLTSILPQ